MMIEYEINKRITDLKIKGIKEYINSEFNFNFDTLKFSNVVVFGINNSIAKTFVSKQNILNIIAIIDDYFQENHFNGIPVLKSNNIIDFKSFYAINLTFSFSAFRFFNKLALANNMKMFNYYEITQYFNFQNDYPYFNNMLIETVKNIDQFFQIIHQLEDNLSKNILLKHLYYRFTFNNSVFLEVQEKFENQYFDIQISDYDIFLDGGCFDGSTSLALLNRNKNIEKIYCFEPDASNLKKVYKNLQTYSQVEVMHCGLWDKEEELCFLSTSDEISRVVENSDNKIILNTIDNLVPNATFIKLDIEGSEAKAIQGAFNTIKNGSPKLAISIYHRPNDLFEILNLIKSINKNYHFYIRHYSDFLFDTILYGKIK